MVGYGGVLPRLDIKWEARGGGLTTPHRVGRLGGGAFQCELPPPLPWEQSMPKTPYHY
jgi:hypothetical protein